MLALTRRKHEAIIIDGNIEVKVLEIQGDKVKLGISAPKSVTVHRQEIYNQIKDANQEAGAGAINHINDLNSLIKNRGK